MKKTLIREVQSCNTLVIWTDADREGENIGFEIINVCKEVNPRLKVYRYIMVFLSYYFIKIEITYLFVYN